eukprot:357806-Chlamydomonas_euryale.AAC.3
MQLRGNPDLFNVISDVVAALALTPSDLITSTMKRTPSTASVALVPRHDARATFLAWVLGPSGTFE